MLAALFARRLERAGINAVVQSAGVSALPGAPALIDAVEVMVEFGIDLSTHESRQLTESMVLDADLVIGLAREHVRETIVLDPAALNRAFTVKELVRRSHQAGRRPPDAELGPWLASLVNARQIDELLGASGDDDVADPVGRPRAVVRQTAAELAGLADAAVSLVWSAEFGLEARQ
jgi:protein-tyrosine phosphatase